MQTLLAQAQTEFNLQEGEFAMLIPDMPAAPPQSPAIVMIAQTNQAQDSTKKDARVLGVCEVIANEKESFPNVSDIYTVSAATMYLVNYENRRDITQKDELAAKTSILRQPTHGTLKESSLPGSFIYAVDAGYVGNDSADILVEVKGVKVKVRYFIHVTEYAEPNPYDIYCAVSGGQWKISQTFDAKGQ
jgi:hypothetical protein